MGGYFSPWVFWETEGPDAEYIEDRMAKEAVQYIRENKHKPFFDPVLLCHGAGKFELSQVYQNVQL